MNAQIVSATFIECEFNTNKDTYYLIAVEEARENFDPMKQQKQFMTLAIDSANVEYLIWRNKLLKEGEFNIAPFASHALQYGKVTHTFTALYPETEYWVYAFAVNPETLEPIGTLHLMTIKTTDESVIDVRFEYRVKGTWDYIYPLDANHNIISQFPYVATTCDSLEIAADTLVSSPQEYFLYLLLGAFIFPEQAKVRFGVQAIDNDGEHSDIIFEEGHTYYTGIGGFDGSFKQCALYKFTWEGDSTDIYFRDEYPINLMRTEDGLWIEAP